MSDSFPLEALKAQAVAARTYAMGRKWVSATRDYDVVDTTQDQVYKGLDADYTNVIAAVEATRGVVGTYNGGFAMCYYTASNGGQTALATDIWGGEGDYGYLAMVDDPYDLENPSSLVNSVTFAGDLSDNAALKAMLEEGLAALNLPYEGRGAGERRFHRGGRSEVRGQLYVHEAALHALCFGHAGGLVRAGGRCLRASVPRRPRSFRGDARLGHGAGAGAAGQSGAALRLPRGAARCCRKR